MIEKYGRVIDDAPLEKYTTYKLSGKIKKVIYPENIENLINLLKYLKKENLKYMVMGNGSNLIFVKDYDGVIIKLDNFKQLEINDNIVKVEAGYNLIKLALETAKLGLSGLEFASGIPATIGGAIYMNAGAYNKQMQNVVKEITVIDDNFNIKELSLEKLHFAYRKSILKEKKYICLSATLKLEKTNKEDILNLIKERKKRRINTQPLDFPSAGSVFRNPEGDFAGRLIENAGLKKVKINDAMVSDKHANFIINTGKATGDDIKKLIMKVKEKVNDLYGIDLIIEQEFIE